MLVHGLDWRAEPGQCWVVLGPNGVGKTRLLHTLAGLLPAAAGEIRVNDRPIGQWSRPRLARQIALLLQDEAPGWWGSVADYVALGMHPHGHSDAGDPAVLAALELTGLAGQADQALRTLSGGERQRARLAQTLAQRTPILLWDEPLNHLDLRQREATLALVQALVAGGRTVVLSLHDPAEARRIGTHALLLYDSGRPRQGPAGTILDEATIRELYAIDLPGPAGPPLAALRALTPEPLATPR
jgi:iron complex transport system ATP-binding protein